MQYAAAERPLSRRRPWRGDRMRAAGAGIARLVMTAAVLTGLSTTFTAAQAAETPAIDTGSTAWVLVASALVLFMTLPGLALFYGGLVRARNFLSVLMHCFAITCIVSVLWAAFGYSLAFDKGNGWIGSLADAFLPGLATRSLPNGLPEA